MKTMDAKVTDKFKRGGAKSQAPQKRAMIIIATGKGQRRHSHIIFAQDISSEIEASPSEV